MVRVKSKRRSYKRMATRFRMTGPRTVVKYKSPFAPGIHRFKEMCEITGIANISAPAGGVGNGLIVFKLNDLFNAGNFKQMFDLYRLTGVKLRILPACDTNDLLNNGGLPASSLAIPKLMLAPNRSPWSVAPGSPADILNDDGCRVYQGTREIKFYLANPAPRIVDGAGNGVPIQTQYSKFWLSTGGNSQVVDQSGVEHYCIRWVLDNQASTIGSANYKVYATYYLKFKEQD